MANSQGIKIRELLENEAREVFKRLLREHSDELLNRFFRHSFIGEMEHIVLPPNERSYYLVSVNERDEALFGINYHSEQNPTISYDICSVARVIKKDSDTVDGWQYLKVLLEQVLIPKCRLNGIKFIGACLESDGGVNAFKELEKGRLPNGCKMKWGTHTVQIIVD